MADQPSQDSRATPPAKDPGYIWLLVGAAAAVIALSFTSFGFLRGALQDLSTGDVPQASGRVFGYTARDAGLVALALYFFLRRGPYRGRGWRHFGILFAVGLVTNGALLLYLLNNAEKVR